MEKSEFRVLIKHSHSPESRKGSKQWVKPGESAPKRPKT